MQLEPVVAHPAVHRRERAQLVPDLLGRRVAPVVPQPACELTEDPGVVARLARRLERLAHALDASLAVRDGPVRLAPRRRARKHDVGHLCRSRHHDVLDDEEVELGQQPPRPVHVGFGLGRVLSDDVQRAELATLHRVEHLREVPPLVGRQLGSPRRREPPARVLVALEVLEARELVRDRAHVSPALHVVLPAERVEARAVAPDVAAEQREVDEREHIVDGVRVLGDPEGPADHRPVGAREGVRRLGDRLGRDAGQPLPFGERERLDRRARRRRSPRWPARRRVG